MAATLDNRSCLDLFMCPIPIGWIRVTVFITCSKTAAGFREKALALVNIRGSRDCNSAQHRRTLLHGLYRSIRAASLFIARPSTVLLSQTKSYIHTLILFRCMLLKMRMVWNGI